MRNANVIRVVSIVYCIVGMVVEKGKKNEPEKARHLGKRSRFALFGQIGARHASAVASSKNHNVILFNPLLHTPTLTILPIHLHKSTQCRIYSESGFSRITVGAQLQVSPTHATGARQANF